MSHILPRISNTISALPLLLCTALASCLLPWLHIGRRIDKLLGGGLREGTLVEVAGETASGKTQLCLSAAATTANRGEEVLFVDTTGSFAPQRVVEMAQAEAASSAGAWSQVRRIFQELTRRLGYRHELCHLRSQVGVERLCRVTVILTALILSL